MVMKKTNLLSIIGFTALLCQLSLFVQPANCDSPKRWRIMPIRSEEEFNLGLIGGEATQHPHSITRSASSPNVLYFAHDCSQFWKSIDGGQTWLKTLGRGMNVHAAQSVEVDPVRPNIVLGVVDAAYNYYVEDYEGLYRSFDYGDTWELVLQFDVITQRTYQHAIAYDKTSTTPNGAARWYLGVPDGSLYRSEDGGKSWTPISSLAGHSSLAAVQTHPTDSQTVYIGSSLGLFRSTSRGTNIQPCGNLPAGEVSAIAVNPVSPTMIYAVVKNVGLYLSVDGGDNFSLLRSGDTTGVFLNPVYTNVIYLTRLSSNILVSQNSGLSWHSPTVTPAPGLGREWKTRINGAMSGVAPDPCDADKAIAYAQAQMWVTTDGGYNFTDSSTLFTGYNWGWWNDAVAYDVADPNKFAFFCADISLAITYNGTDWFDRRRVPYEWYTAGLISWPGMHAGDIEPVPGSELMIGSVGMYWDTKLVRSEDAGLNWTIVENRSENHLFIAFNTDDPNIVYAGDKISSNKGVSFDMVGYLDPNDASIVGMCLAQPDTIYAMRRPRNIIYRSDDRGQSWRIYVQAGWSFNGMDSKPTFAVAPNDPDKIYTLYSNRDLASYNGSSWQSLGVLPLAGGAQFNNFVRAVHIDPRYPNVIYAATHTPGLDFIFRTTDGGQTWEDITYNLPRAGCGAISVHPLTGDFMHSGCYGTWILAPPYESPNAIYYKSYVSREIENDWDDLAVLVAHWLQQDCDSLNDWCTGTDLDFNSTVDMFDLTLFAYHWLDWL